MAQLRQPDRVELRCAKRMPFGDRCGRLLERVYVIDGRMVTPRVTTDLADRLAVGADYVQPDWTGSSPWLESCRCGSTPKLKYETLERLVLDAVAEGEPAIYV